MKNKLFIVIIFLVLISTIAGIFYFWSKNRCEVPGYIKEHLVPVPYQADYKIKCYENVCYDIQYTIDESQITDKFYDDLLPPNTVKTIYGDVCDLRLEVKKSFLFGNSYELFYFCNIERLNPENNLDFILSLYKLEKISKDEGRSILKDHDKIRYPNTKKVHVLWSICHLDKMPEGWAEERGWNKYLK